MKKIFFILLFLITATQSIASTSSWETISGSRDSGGFGWNYSYDIGLCDNTIKIDLDIKLAGDAVEQTLLNRWETGIENIWSTTKFIVPILFNVDWVSDDFDQIVTIHKGDTEVFNMSNWNTVDANGWGDSFQEEVAAHEFGHMFGLWDEYEGGAVNPITNLIGTGGLMETLNGDTLDPYYDNILGWYQKKITPVPVPASIWLFSSGFVGFLGMRKKT